MRYFTCLTGLFLATILFAQPSRAAQPTTTGADVRAAVVEEIKTDQDAVKTITEVASDDKDAHDAEEAAKNPPSNLADSEKQAYVDTKKNDEQTAQDQAKEARERLKEAQKALDDAKAKLKALDDGAKKAA